MKKMIVFLMLAGMNFVSSAQTYGDQFAWDDEDWFSQIDRSKSDDIQILFRDRANEFAYDEEGELMEYYFFRSVVYLKTDKGVTDYNKIYINISNALELVDYNARVLFNKRSPQLLGDSALKTGTTEEGKTYNYFAVEGAEEGSIVDYYFVIKTYPSYRGIQVNVQGSSPIDRYRIRIISPWNLVFNLKSLNGEMHVYNDTTDTVNNVVVAEAEKLQALPNEGFSNQAAHTLQIVYKLEDNLATGSYNMFTYGTVSQNVIDIFNAGVDKKTLKALNKFLKDLRLDDDLDEQTRIRSIENYLKKQVTIVEGNSPQLSDLKFVLDNKVASDYGIMKLFYNVFKHFDIGFEVVVTSNRYTVRFPDDIENYAFLDEYLLYFPSIDDYMMPSAQLYRLGIIPYGYIHNNGLFIREVEVGGIRTGAGKVKAIKPYSKDHSSHDLWIEASLSDDLNTAVVKMKEVMTGFNALNFQPYYDYVSEDGLSDLEKATVENFGEEIDIKEVEPENTGVDHLMVDPFIVHSTYENQQLVEMAGNNILFKLGDLIGPQAEMYEEEERKLDIENTYLHGYYREIVFTIPEGYECTNLEDLEMNIAPFEEMHTLFTSEYEVKGDQIIIKVNEYYDKMTISRERYEDYRAVINAAADFNKITLVLEKRV